MLFKSKREIIYYARDMISLNFSEQKYVSYFVKYDNKLINLLNADSNTPYNLGLKLVSLYPSLFSSKIFIYKNLINEDKLLNKGFRQFTIDEEKLFFEGLTGKINK